MDESITVERVRHALVVGRLDADGAAVLLAANLPPKRDRTYVVVGSSALDAVGRLDPWVTADLADAVHGDLCVVAPRFGSMGRDGALPPAKLLAERLGVEVTAPDGDPTALADGSLFVAGPGAGWVSYRPDGRRIRVGARLPAPWWQDGLPAASDHLVHVPSGLWVRRPGGPDRGDDRLLRQVPDPDRMYVVLGAPGEEPPAAATVAEVLRGLPDENRGRAVLACYGFGGGELVRAVSGELGAPVRVAHGVPGDGGLVQVDEAGEARWRPFALETVYRRDGAPVLDRWVAPASLAMVEPGSYQLVEGWRVDVVPRGLVVRPEAVRVDDAVAAADPGPAAEVVFAADSAVPPEVVTAFDQLVRDLPAEAREGLRILAQCDPSALAGIEAADRVVPLPAPAEPPSGAREAVPPPRGAVVVLPDGRVLPAAPILATPGPRTPGTGAGSAPLPPAQPVSSAPAPQTSLPPSLRPAPSAPAPAPVRQTPPAPQAPAAVSLPSPVQAAAAAAPPHAQPAPPAPPLPAPPVDAPLWGHPRSAPPGGRPPWIAQRDAPRGASALAAQAVAAAPVPVREVEVTTPLPAVPSTPAHQAEERTVGAAAPASPPEPNGGLAGALRSTGPTTAVPPVRGEAATAGATTAQASTDTAANPRTSAGTSTTAEPGTTPKASPSAESGTTARTTPTSERGAEPARPATGSLPSTVASSTAAGTPAEPAARSTVDDRVGSRTELLPEPDPAPVAAEVVEVPEDARSTPEQRQAMRTVLGTRYDVATRAVTRLLSERPGMRFAAEDRAALLAELAVVRVFADDPTGEYDADFHVCLADGLRRLPTVRTVVVRGIPADTAVRPETVLRLRAPVVAAPAGTTEPVGPAEALIWTTTGRRLDGLLDEPSEHRDDVVLTGHTRLRVLAVESEPVHRVLLAEDGAAREAALTRLRAAAAARADVPARRPTGGRWFGPLPVA
ncbi:hypothetical protein [Saccharopolyspora hordei]|uniref:Uncharacterized protein n=1 Tax=Saccharopolyspora hordei TaxID=1838 RepID=A0A853AUD2_9PSEU|nr:hypothetical protein [Saccharopolyspora hordei]NYI86260.1 hypothetical protein [Saccharopolyspora hordei]